MHRSVLLHWALLALLITVGSAGCVGSPEPADLAVASYPAAFLAHELAGDDLRVVQIGGGSGVHDFEPSTQDLAQLRQVRHLVLWDASMETWAHRAVGSLGQHGPTTMELMRAPGAGLLAPDHAEDGHGDDANGHDVHADENDPEADEHDARSEEDGTEDHGAPTDEHDVHTWMDPLALRASIHALEEQLVAAYPQHAANITARAEALEKRLQDLHVAFEAGLAECRHDRIVTNHNAYAYLAQRYAFTVTSLHGLEPGAEATSERVSRALDELRDLGLPVLFIEEGTRPSVVRAVQQETGVEVRVLHTLETAPEEGDLIDEQLRNLEQLRFALGCT